MRLFVANWKMNLTRVSARDFARELGALLPHPLSVELAIAPSFTALDAARDPGGRWALSAQNVASEPCGAFTGEISAEMLAEAGCRYVLVGHSERRRIFGEGPDVLALKVARARESGLVPIFCVGETAQERTRGATAEVLARQLTSLEGDPPGAPLVVAYEPVWAIGSGNAATPADAGRAREELARRLAARPDVRILYGGSVAAENAEQLLQGSGVDGFLIGGASLEAASFAAIAGLPGARRGRA